MENNVNYRPSRNKPPVYTSDKRAKFTQRANKKWIRLATVAGYMISVSTPAVILSIYYVFFWNPNYTQPTETKNSSNATSILDSTNSGTMKKRSVSLPRFRSLDDKHPSMMEVIPQSPQDSSRDQLRLPGSEMDSPEIQEKSAARSFKEFEESPQCLPCICPATEEKSMDVKLEEILSGSLDRKLDLGDRKSAEFSGKSSEQENYPKSSEKNR